MIKEIIKTYKFSKLMRVSTPCIIGIMLYVKIEEMIFK